jgi:hypothetical protein
MVEKFHEITELLQYLSVNDLVIDAAGTLTKVGATFTTQFAEGDFLLLANAGLNNGRIWEVEDVTDTVITVKLLSTLGVALQTETINTILEEVYFTPWRNVSNYNEISSVINASQNLTAYMEQSFDRSIVHFSKTQAVVGGTAKADTDTLYATHARMKYVNNAAIQTTFSAFFAGRYKI